MSYSNSISINPFQSLSIGAVGSQTTAGQLFSIDYGQKESSNIKRYQVIETTEDLLALSCAWYRIRNANHTLQPHITNLLADELFNHLRPEDREMADKVRDYYTKKFMVMTLKDQKLTMFRQDLKDYLVGAGNKFVEKTIPMIYRMPEFYVHDVAFDEIKIDFEKTIPKFDSLTRRVTERNVKLTPIKSFKKNSKSRGKFVEYWLKDSRNHAYRFGIRQENTLLGLWDTLFNSGEMTISLNVQTSRRDDLEFFNIGSILEG